MNDLEHGFAKYTFEEVETFPIELLLGEVDDVIVKLKKLVKQARKDYPQCEQFVFLPDGIDLRVPAFQISKRGSVPDSIIEPLTATVFAEIAKSKQAIDADIYSNYMGTIKLIGIRTETAEEMRERPQSKEERKALESRERALLARLKKKYEDTE